MFKKLKGLFKSKNEQTSANHGLSDEGIINWEILPANPGSISVLESNNPEKYPDLPIAEFLYDLMKKNGWNVHLVKSVSNHIWIYVEDNGYYLLPLLNWNEFDENGKSRVGTTIQIHHKKLFPDGIFEYQYSSFSDNIVEAIDEAFYLWFALDWETLADFANPEKDKYMKQTLEMDFEDKKVIKHLFFGGVFAFPDDKFIKKLKAEGNDIDSYIDQFCPCCLFTKSITAFDMQIKDTARNYAIRLFASKSPDGKLEADCRINGEEYPEGEEYLKKYAETWKDCDIIKLRKQYVIIGNEQSQKPNL